MSKAKFSQSTQGIYPKNAFKQFPDDALDIPDDLYAKFQSGEIPGFDVVNGQVVEKEEATFSNVPASISTAQGHLALIEYGKFQAAVDFINGISDPTEKLKAEVNFYRRNDWQRDNPTLLALAQGLGITDQELDQMFIFGATQ